MFCLLFSTSYDLIIYTKLTMPKNEDEIRHGFTSALFHNHLIRTDAGGVQVYGKGMEGLYIGPGKTVQLRFQVDWPGDYPFQCDLHPHMKSELLLLHVDVA